jgi:hemerythrin
MKFPNDKFDLSNVKITNEHSRLFHIRNIYENLTFQPAEL